MGFQVLNIILTFFFFYFYGERIIHINSWALTVKDPRAYRVDSKSHILKEADQVDGESWKNVKTADGRPSSALREMILCVFCGRPSGNNPLSTSQKISRDCWLTQKKKEKGLSSAYNSLWEKVKLDDICLFCFLLIMRAFFTGTSSVIRPSGSVRSRTGNNFYFGTFPLHNSHKDTTLLKWLHNFNQGKTPL